MRTSSLFRMAVAGMLAAGCYTAQAQQAPGALTYQLPPQEILQMADAAPTPSVSISADGKTALHLRRAAYPSIAQIAQPELRIAGLRLNPRTNGPSRATTFNGFALQDVATGEIREVTGLPAEPRMMNVSWSPLGTHIAFVQEVDNDRQAGLELWVIDVATGKASKLTEAVLNATFGSPISWHPSGQSILIRRVLPSRGPAPADNRTPTGPAVQENAGRAAPAPTFQDLLKNPADEARFDYHGMAHLAEVALDGSVKNLPVQGIIMRNDWSPDGNYLLVMMLKRPYSYTVPASRFPTDVVIADRSGKTAATVANLPLNDAQSRARDAVAPGMRSFSWRADAPATLVFAEAPDGGDPAKQTEYRDIVYTMTAPFTAPKQELLKLQYRYQGIMWGNDQLAMVNEFWVSQPKVRTSQFAPAKPSAMKVLFERSWEDRYADKGAPVMHQGPYKRPVIKLVNKGKDMLLVGEGAGPEGDRPFLDRYELATGKTTRLFQSQAPYYETVVDVLDEAGTVVLTSRESLTEVPNYWVRNLVKRLAPRQLTRFADPYPQLRQVKKELIKYKRADGVELTGTLYLPAGFTPGKDAPLPCLMWAYPTEFKSAAAASQVQDSPYRFTRLSWGSPLFWLMRGYAVLDDPAMPIVGEGNAQPNDTYIQQLVGSAQAAVDEVVRRGVADPKKIAVGGHSYGAFMTANLLTHSKLFAAGIARSGAYNRTLTPFGFQNEDRSYWEASKIYFDMSPFNYVPQMKTPLLLIHGEMDNNQGTFPIQSERYFAALKGHGAVVRLVMLPNESHGYQARESVLHTLWEMDSWLERFVKNAK